MTPEGWRRVWLVVAGVSGAMAVGFGAYAAHAPAGLTRALQLIDTASRYQLTHAAALLVVAQLQREGGRLALLAGMLFTLGMVLFCGGIYAMAVGSLPVGPAVPLGGTSFLLGWLAVAVSAWTSPSHPDV